MGYATAAGYAEAVEEGAIDLDTALAIHLTSNCYPPYPVAFVPLCRQAIELVNGDEADAPIEGVTHHGSGRPVTAGEYVEGMHLEAFLNQDEE